MILVVFAAISSLAADRGCCKGEKPGVGGTDSEGEGFGGTESPEAPPGCAGPIDLDTSGTTGFDGVQFGCEGDGFADFRAEVSCELPEFCTPFGNLAENIPACVNANDVCPDHGIWSDDDDDDGGKPPREIDVNLFAYQFHGDGAIVGCCDPDCIIDNGESCGLDQACMAGCVNMGCENVPTYLENLLSDVDAMAKICCTKVDEEYDCLGEQPGNGPLIDMCKSAITIWHAQTETGFRNKCLGENATCVLEAPEADRLQRLWRTRKSGVLLRL